MHVGGFNPLLLQQLLQELHVVARGCGPNKRRHNAVSSGAAIGRGTCAAHRGGGGAPRLPGRCTRAGGPQPEHPKEQLHRKTGGSQVNTMVSCPTGTTSRSRYSSAAGLSSALQRQGQGKMGAAALGRRRACALEAANASTAQPPLAPAVHRTCSTQLAWLRTIQGQRKIWGDQAQPRNRAAAPKLIRLA